MAKVTVCIPAYRSDPFIHHTLASVRDQTFDDFEVEIGIEPVEAGPTLEACDPFVADPRFRSIVNDEVLGYAGNVGALLRRVQSPLFVVLPHDDAWHPRFLERLHEVLRARPDAVCAYSDCLRFAPEGRGTGIAGQEIIDAGLSERVVSWFLGGAGGFPWRGLTRSTVLWRDFPDSPYQGFAVECEWSLHLLLQGGVLHVPEPLYLKRQPTSLTPNSVSASWVRDESGLHAALDHHRQRLLAMVPDQLSREDFRVARLAAETAVLRRRLEFARGRWGLTPEQARLATDLLETAGGLEPSIAARMTATVRWVLSRHWSACGDEEEAERQARQGLAVAPDDALLCVQLGSLLIARDAVMEAVEVGLRASRAHPDDAGIRGLVRSCEARLERQLRPRAGMLAGPTSRPPLVTGPETSMTLLQRRVAQLERVSQAAERRASISESRSHSLGVERDALRRELRTVRAAAQAPRGWRWRLRKALSSISNVLVRFGGPNPLFDPAWYRATYGDVPSRSLLAWWHWRREGWREGRDPNALFDTDWYLITYQDVRRSGMDPLAHYLLYGSSEGRDPGPAFDTSAYLERYPDVRVAGIDPLLHFQRAGRAEGRIVTPRPGS